MYRFRLIPLLALLPFSLFAGGIGGFVTYLDSSDAGDGTGVGGLLQLGVSEEVALELRVSKVDDFEADLQLPFIVTPLELEVTPIEAGFTFDIPLQDSITPYLGIGAGIYLIDAELDDFDADLDDEFGWYALGGVRIGLSNTLHVFGEIFYRSLEGTVNDSRDFTLEDTDVDLGSLGANLGIMARW